MTEPNPDYLDGDSCKSLDVLLRDEPEDDEENGDNDREEEDDEAGDNEDGYSE
jgi:hypothetical protein